GQLAAAADLLRGGGVAVGLVTLGGPIMARASIRLRPCSLVGLALALAGCGDEFTSESRPTTFVETTSTFPSVMAHTDRATLQVKVADSLRDLSAARVVWSSSNAQVIEVIPDTARAGGS